MIFDENSSINFRLPYKAPLFVLVIETLIFAGEFLSVTFSFMVLLIDCDALTGEVLRVLI